MLLVGDKVQVRGWDSKKKAAPPAIPPDPDIEKEKGPKGINTPNLLKRLWRDRADGNARSARYSNITLKRGFAIALGMVIIFGVVFTAAFYGIQTGKYLSLETVAKNLAVPIKFDIAPDGRIFYNEFVNGSIRIIENGVVLEQAFATVDLFVEAGATGMTGLILYSSEKCVMPLKEICSNQTYVYVFYTYSRLSGEAVCTAAGCEEGTIIANRVSRFVDMGNVAGPEEVIIEDLPANDNWDHFGGVLRFGPDGKLYISVGDATVADAVQEMSRLNGKILRLNPDGSIPDDNPFPDSPIYLLGVRNVYGMDFVEDTLYFTDNGPVGHDELNIGVAGGNFGWPYYAGNVSNRAEIPEGDYIGPVIDFTPAIAPTGIAYYTGNKLGEFQNTVFFGGWKTTVLYTLRGETSQEELWTGSPILGVVDGPDGYLYISFIDRIARLVWDNEPYDWREFFRGGGGSYSDR